jgi:hypothetical protein
LLSKCNSHRYTTGASKSQPSKSGAPKASRGAPKEQYKPETYVPIPDKIPRAEAAARARANPADKKQTPFTVTEGVVVVSLGRVDARPKFHSPLNVYPVGYKTEWTNPDGTAKVGLYKLNAV